MVALGHPDREQREHAVLAEAADDEARGEQLEPRAGVARHRTRDPGDPTGPLRLVADLQPARRQGLLTGRRGRRPRRGGVDDREEHDCFPRRLQAARHFERDEAAERVPPEQVGTARLDPPHVGDIPPRARLDRPIGNRALLEPARLDAVHRSPVGERVRERAQRRRGRAAAGDEEQWHPVISRTELDHRRRRVRSAVVEERRELRGRRRGEQHRRRQVDSELLVDRRHQLDRGERITAEVEEVVVEPDPVDCQHAGEDAGEHGFASDRFTERTVRAIRCHGQRVAVDLPARRQRQLVDGRDGSGHHRGRKCLGESPPHLPRAGVPARGRDDEPDEPCPAVTRRHRNDRGL